MAAYKKALEIDPKDVQSALGMGWAYSYGKNWDGSIVAFEQAIQIDPKTAGEAHNGMAWAFLFKKDVPKAKEFAEKAKTEGRPDGRLTTNIDRMEKALANPGASGADTAKLQEDLDKAYAEQKKVQRQMDDLNKGLKGGPAGRRSALASIAGLIGPQDALPYLIRGLQDPDWSVREAAASAIGAIACSAKIAVPYLNAIVNGPKADNIQMTKEEMQQMVRDEDLRRSARDAVAKIQACK